MLDAAREVFAEKGFRRATLDEIAQRAEFGKGTLYNYFEGGKDEMLLAIVDEFYDDMCAITQSIFSSEEMATARFGNRLYEYFHRVISYFEESRELFVVMMKESTRMLLGDDQEDALHLKDQHTRVADLLIPAIETASARDELKPMSPFLLAHMILGNLDGFLRFSCWHEVGNVDCTREATHSPEEAARFLAEILMEGMGLPGSSLTGTSGPVTEDIPTNGS
jgi:AcrR family transcriptional regulator